MRGELGEILALQINMTASRGDQTGDRVQDRRLTRTVCTDERNDLALVDLKGNTLDGIDHAVIYLNIFYF